MQQERWKQISQLFEAALDLKPDERAAFLAEQCRGDEPLRQEIEQLISSHQKASADEFMGIPAAEQAAPLLVDQDKEESVSPRLASGQRVGNYEIKDLLGRGGMGEVYRARDLSLDRSVALKVLPNEFSSDKRRMLRFKQEAKAVSALNQPNILTIFEFGEERDLHFLACELIEGTTLRHQLKAKQLELSEILDIAIQVANALEAAHEAGIVHRDIKPENIMIRQRDGLVKVLDFGLAKLASKSSLVDQPTDTEAPTEVQFQTVPGSLVGTFKYMSPEQARGQPVDHRSDLWSCGVVIYEMVVGRTPFVGETPGHTIVSVMEKEPEQLSQSARIGVPAELQRIVSKSLKKNPEERYQSAKDLLIDLKSLRQELEIAGYAPRGRSSVEWADSNRSRSKLAGRKVVLALAALVVVGLVTAFVINWRRQKSVASPALPAPVQRQLEYSVTVQRFRDGKPYKEPFQLADVINFEEDDRIRLNIRARESGYLYVLNQSPVESEPLSILFPSPTTNRGSAYVAPDSQITIPEASWFRLDADQGREKVWFVWAPGAVEALEAVRRFANPDDRGVIKDGALNRAALALLQSDGGPNATVEEDASGKLTVLRNSKPFIIHRLTLEHH